MILIIISRSTLQGDYLLIHCIQSPVVSLREHVFYSVVYIYPEVYNSGVILVDRYIVSSCVSDPIRQIPRQLSFIQNKTAKESKSEVERGC